MAGALLKGQWEGPLEGTPNPNTLQKPLYLNPKP